MDCMNFNSTDDGLDISQKRKPTILESNALYLLILGLMLLSSFLVSDKNILKLNPGYYYLTTTLLEIFLIGLPPLIYMLATKMNIPEIIRLNRLSVKEFLLVVGMAFSGYGVVIFINIIWIWIISFIGPPIQPPAPPVNSVQQYLLGILCIGVVPAVVEEFLFRGVILRGYERLGTIVSIVITGVLFGLLHMSLATLPAILLLGIVISYVVQRSNSIFAGITYHFVNNSIAVTLTFAQNAMQKLYKTADIMPSDIRDIPLEIMIIGIVVWGVIALFALGIFTVCFISFNKETAAKATVQSDSIKTEKRVNFLEMFPVIISVIIVVFVLAIEIMAMLKGM